MKGKHTTKINGYLIDVTEEYHKKYRPEESRHTYLKKQEKNVEIVSLEGLAKDEIRGMDVIADPNVNVEEEVIKKVLLILPLFSSDVLCKTDLDGTEDLGDQRDVIFETSSFDFLYENPFCKFS